MEDAKYSFASLLGQNVVVQLLHGGTPISGKMAAYVSAPPAFIAVKDGDKMHVVPLTGFAEIIMKTDAFDELSGEVE